MAKKKKKPSEIPKPGKIRHINPLVDPEEITIPADDPDIIPDEDPFESPPPFEIPEPGEGP